MLFVDCDYDAGVVLSYRGIVLLDVQGGEARELQRFCTGSYDDDLKSALRACVAEFGITNPRLRTSVLQYREDHRGEAESTEQIDAFENSVGMSP